MLATLISVLGFVLLVLILLGAVKAIMALLPYVLGALVLLGVICYLCRKPEVDPDESK